MRLFKLRGAAIILLIAAFLTLFSGCINSTPSEVVPPVAPGAQVLPIPIPGPYIKDSAITIAKMNDTSVNSTVLMAGAIRNNQTFNRTGTVITGTTLIALDGVNGTITVNRTSILLMTLSIDSTSTGGAGIYSYGSVRVAGSNSAAVAATPSLITIGQQGGVNATSYTFYNSSVPSGTYNISFAAASHGAAGVLTLTNITLTTIALPS